MWNIERNEFIDVADGMLNACTRDPVMTMSFFVVEMVQIDADT